MKREELVAEMKRIGATIGMYEIKRQRGEYVSMNVIEKLKREFRKLQNTYKSRYFKLI